MAFCAVEPLLLMIPSRCSDEVGLGGRPRPMTEVRRAMKAAPDSLDGRFQKYFHRKGVLRAQVNTGEGAIERGRQAAVSPLLDRVPASAPNGYSQSPCQ